MKKIFNSHDSQGTVLFANIKLVHYQKLKFRDDIFHTFL